MSGGLVYLASSNDNAYIYLTLALCIASLLLCLRQNKISSPFQLLYYLYTKTPGLGLCNSQIILLAP